MALLPRTPQQRPEIDLAGTAGNAFALLGYANQLAKQLDLDFTAIQAEMKSGDYKHLVETFDKHFGDYVDLILPEGGL